MKRLTIKTVNKALAGYGYEVVQGNGYLYFWPLENRKDLPNDLPSVPVCRLNHIPTVEEWVKELRSAIQYQKDHNYYGIEL